MKTGKAVGFDCLPRELCAGRYAGSMPWLGASWMCSKERRFGDAANEFYMKLDSNLTGTMRIVACMTTKTNDLEGDESPVPIKASFPLSSISSSSLSVCGESVEKGVEAQSKKTQGR